MICMATVFTCIVIRWQQMSVKKCKGNVIIQRFLCCTWWLIGETGSKWRTEYNKKYRLAEIYESKDFANEKVRIKMNLNFIFRKWRKFFFHIFFSFFFKLSYVVLYVVVFKRRS